MRDEQGRPLTETDMGVLVTFMETDVCSGFLGSMNTVVQQNQMFIQFSGNHLFCQNSDGQVRKSVVLWEKREKCVQELLIIQFKLAILSNIWSINCGSDIMLNKYLRRRDGSS